MCLNIPAVWFVVLYKNNLTIDKIQLTLFFYDIRETSLLFRTAGLVLIESTSVVLKWEAVKWPMNFVLRATLSFYTVAHAIQSVSAILWRHWRGSRRLAALRKPREPHKDFRHSVQFISMERGEVSFFPFFKMNIYYCILQKGKGAKTPTIQAEWF